LNGIVPIATIRFLKERHATSGWGTENLGLPTPDPKAKKPEGRHNSREKGSNRAGPNAESVANYGFLKKQ